MWTCEGCPRYSECTSLCATAEFYVNQDHVSRRYNVIFAPTHEWEPGCVTLDYLHYKYGLNASSLGYDLDFHSVDLSFLTPREKDCLYLFYFEGKKLREIGEMLGIDLKTAHEYIRRAKAKCKKEFGRFL